MTYRNTSANHWTATDEGIAMLYNLRRDAARDVQMWLGFKKNADREWGKFVKEMHKDALRLEKAATIWINHFMTTGRKNIANFPLELKAELDYVFFKACYAHETSGSSS